MEEDRLIAQYDVDASVTAEATHELAPSIVIPAEQLEPIRDRWMRPLVDRIAALERDAGRLEAERDQARAQADTAIRERDNALSALKIMTLERNTLLVSRDRLRERMKVLEYNMRSAQDTTALRAIERYDGRVRRPVRHRRMAFWKRD